MPVPGPRTQDRDRTVRNPDGELPTRFHLPPYHGVAWLGRSAGLMTTTLRGCVLGAGQVRRLWRQTAGYIGAADDYSWTRNGPVATRERPPFQITRALRYLTRSLYVAGGTDNTRLSELHTVVTPRVRSKPTTVNAGQKRYAPTVRNRLTSFGSRVEPLNRRVPAGEEPGA